MNISVPVNLAEASWVNDDELEEEVVSSVHMLLEVCLFVARLLFKHRTYEMQKCSESYFNLLMFAQLIRNSSKTCGLIKSNRELFSLFVFACH